MSQIGDRIGLKPRATYEALIAGLAPLGLAYLSVLHADPASDLIQDLRRAFGGTFIVNSGFSTMTTREEAVTAVDEGIADLIAVGRPAIANPDLVTRWEQNADENEVDQASVYGPDERGYTDYPFLQD
ncbi:NADH:flavin oxidoreductase / NADH oxidase family protein [Microbacterium hydrothermale]|uniref:hypothetical protein n=1 Tax=Microbacterium hydrothermale TaxID=857427 RepID=UPI0022274EE4|nr:hypothetical protein [Microbacterium hydrothermale]MCW2162881.1 NADH:flavin oxidoreductase / NADH oxidase family protein [Microbacterium hydrothermale]